MKKNKTKKIYGGDGNVQSTNPPEGEQILQQIKQDRENKRQNSASVADEARGILGNTVTLIKGVTTNGVKRAGKFAGVDLDNPENTNREFNELISNSAIIGAAALQASEPFIQPLVDKTLQVAEKSGSKIAESGVKILLNTAEEIPGVGVLIGTIRSLSNAGEAFTASTDAFAEMTTAYADVMNATAKNMSNQVQEAKQVGGRTVKSISEFNRPHNNNNNNSKKGGKRVTRKRKKRT
jgi:hypothetical protein